MKFKAQGKWKAVPMTQALFGPGSDGSFCGGIEVLDNYVVTKGQGGGGSSLKATKKRKIELADGMGGSKKPKLSFVVSDIQKAKEPKEKQDKAKKSKKVKQAKPVIDLDAIGELVGNKDALTKKPKLCEERQEKNVPDKVDSTDKISETSPPKPTEAMNQWRDLFVCDELMSCLERKGFLSPTPIQRLTLPPAIKGRMDIVGAAETGSGKTLAFGIPLVQGILRDKKFQSEKEALDGNEDDESEESNDNKSSDNELRGLILTPTRELAIQIKDHLKAITTDLGVSVVVVVGGMSSEKQIRLLNRRPDIVVATPGRLWDLIQDNVEHLRDLSTVRYFVIDEADRMNEKGHFAELEKILEILQADRHPKRQTFVMSATLSLVHKPPAYSKGKKAKQLSPEQKLNNLISFAGVRDKRKVVDITKSSGTAESLSESVIHCSLTEKDSYLYYLVSMYKARTIVFCNSIDCVRRLVNLFSLLDIQPLSLHAQMHQKQRLKNLERFAQDPRGLLISTDVAARGLDIPNIEHVVHYQVPRTSESYVHRSGRTARACKEGLSVILMDPSELMLYKKLTNTLNRKTDLPTFPVNMERMDKIFEMMNVARRLDKLLLETRKQAVSANWKKKAAEEADILISDDEDSDVDQNYEDAKRRDSVANCRRELSAVLKSLANSKMGGKYPTMYGAVNFELGPPTTKNAVEILQQDLGNNILKKKTNSAGNKRKKFKKKGKKSKVDED